MKTAYFIVILLALTFVPKHADAWWFISNKWLSTGRGWGYASKRRLDVPNDAVDPVEVMANWTSMNYNNSDFDYKEKFLEAMKYDADFSGPDDVITSHRHVSNVMVKRSS
ncbi:uncharacterized protein LOC121378360 isoform X2 [Gigantopelta aegis]|uniref:uncharacterized protein LOC121378360 isoform X2 n=1 Tax=Gigantopelta aegis TaxID=1735272 RepID=UPI001B88ADCD|nr:uncharacterized protein LOC121378360 isoform X2 [Gigantopelta aegis]